ncbi:MAG: efflux RND transporter periplasmic adaptor subunit [Acidobacteriota bacterium]
MCLLAVLLSTVACNSRTSSDPPARGGRQVAGPVPVVVAQAETRSMPVTVAAVGTVEASSTVDIRAQVTGQLSGIHFREGQDVAAGAPLFSLDERPFRAALQQAEAVLARDTAQSTNAQGQLKRYTDLFNRGLIPRDQYETQAANANALEATLEADRAAAENARLNLQYAQIRAPIAGRTGALNVHVGDLVRANDTTPLVTINQLSPVYVTFSVPGRSLADIRRYSAMKPLTVSVRPSLAQPAEGSGTVATSGTVAADAQAPRTDGETGAVTFIDNMVDPTTGTIKLKATFPNRDRALWPGLFVQATLTLTTNPHALVVPAVAVQTGQQGQFVYVVKEDHTVEVRPVRLDREVGTDAIIAQGLTPGERVVTDGQLRLVPGARVTVKSS